MLVIGAFYQHPDHGLVYIRSGEYTGGYGRISNFWYWSKVRDGIVLDKQHHGYGGDWPLVKRKIQIRVLE